MSLIEQARSLVNEVVHEVIPALDRDASDAEAPLDIMHESLDAADLERASAEWAAPPKHR